jgi:hypothetical protein
MNQHSNVEEYQLPQAEALLAGTMALMTSVALAEAGCPYRAMKAAKISANLCELAGCPELSDALRFVLMRVQAQWACAGLEPLAPHAAQGMPLQPTRH